MTSWGDLSTAAWALVAAPFIDLLIILGIAAIAIVTIIERSGE